MARKPDSVGYRWQSKQAPCNKNCRKAPDQLLIYVAQVDIALMGYFTSILRSR